MTNHVKLKLAKVLNNEIDLFIFPSIKVTPQEFVSNALIKAILDCDDVIVLNEKASLRSFWVAFERDYAIRAGKPVYNYDAKKQQILKHQAPPIDLAIYPSFAHPMRSFAKPVIEHMQNERFFDLFLDTLGIGSSLGDVVDFLETGMEQYIGRGGYVVSFFDEDRVPDGPTVYSRKEMAQAFELNHLIIANFGNKPVRDYPDEIVVQITDKNGVNNNHIDDLIVRLYWLILRNQYTELAYE